MLEARDRLIKKGGDPLLRFASKVEFFTDTGCWQWLGGTKNTYGRFRMPDSDRLAHRFVYEQVVGPIPAGLTIHHHCENRLCVNPDHLESMSLRDNLFESDTPARRNALKTHCPRGHPYSDTNTRITRTGTRQCRICGRAAHREYMRKRRVA